MNTKPFKDNLTFEQVRAEFDYNPITGLVTRKSNGCVFRSKTGSGYVSVSFKGENYAAHRVAWLWSYGMWPTDQIDHINQIKSDNRIINLRIATRAQQQVNTSHKRNKYGFRGVAFQSVNKVNKWVAHIYVNKKSIFLGSFFTKEEAGAAYLQAREKYYGEFIRSSPVGLSHQL